MLQSSFKTQIDLGLDYDQYKALRDLLSLMESGGVIHSPTWSLVRRKLFAGILNKIRPTVLRFNMNVWYDERDGLICGCLAGLANHLAGKQVFSHIDMEFPSELANLFFPHEAIWDSGEPWRKIKPAYAAATLREYLTTGVVVWR